MSTTNHSAEHSPYSVPGFAETSGQLGHIEESVLYVVGEVYAYFQLST